jgi:hypothetical protein
MQPVQHGSTPGCISTLRTGVSCKATERVCIVRTNTISQFVLHFTFNVVVSFIIYELFTCLGESNKIV